MRQLSRVSLLVMSVSFLSTVFASEAASPAGNSSPWLGVVGSLGGLILGAIQFIVGLSLAAYSVNKGLDILSQLLGGINIWAEIKKKNAAIALLAAGVVISYTRVIAGGIDAMTKSLAATFGGEWYIGLIGLLSGLINLGISILVASFAITVVFRVMDKLTSDIDEKTEFANGNVAIGIVYCGILIGVSGLVTAGVTGIGSGFSVLLTSVIRALVS